MAFLPETSIADKIKTMNTPLVTIACITYNHEDYIRQALDSFLSQDVDFSFEIIVHDDASTDNTPTILKEYKDKYPEIIRLILRKENLYSMGVNKIFYHGIFKSEARGKYIATCEGDDYWINDQKLRIQVGFLESHPNFNFSIGKVKVLDDHTGQITDMIEHFDPQKKTVLRVKDYLKYFPSHTSSYVFRADYDQPRYCDYFHGEDLLIPVIATKEKKIKYHNEYFSVYRKHSGGVTNLDFNWKMHYLDILYYTEALRQIIGGKYPLVFLSIRWKVYLYYKDKSTKNPLMKKYYNFLNKINNFIRWKLL